MTSKANPWVTPKIFPDPERPAEQVAAFFEHYSDWFSSVDEVVLTFATGNGDHILNFRGNDHRADEFDWARYNSFAGNQKVFHEHNRNWLNRVREGGERSDNPYMAGPMVIISDARLSYDTLAGIYAAFRTEAALREVTLSILEYLEPGPEFCESTWKSDRHPEVADSEADAGGNVSRGLIDVCAPMHADDAAYAAYPNGIPSGTIAGDFVAAQSAAFVHSMGLDGILLGNQFGLLGLWNPAAAPPATLERRDGVTRFFQRMRDSFGAKMIYWQDSFWPADVEEDAWAMASGNYGLLDGIICSNFGVLVERTNIETNILSKAKRVAGTSHHVDIFFSFDFVDPWYWYRTYLDDRRIFTYQHEVFARVSSYCTGTMFFANDTFGHFVPKSPLNETLAVVSRAATARKTPPLTAFDA